ncbi:IDEAL domain-containing protein [Priestia koreensis]|uniref:IDEAL domain-containing protein n=1 Tax=Priestia koreensis TaxID=284581 RepID=A0A0M0LI31_9BACI|nr:IDEAL domain-containing protein [Priestia koreensis]KOO50552.1 hypothetical protein AMD01_02035 [Priestia koreensis]
MSYYRKNANDFSRKDLYTQREIQYQKTANDLLDHLSYVFNKERLTFLIDDALDKGDKETFIQLTNEYKKLEEA